MTSTTAAAIVGRLEPQQSFDAWNIAKARFLDGLDEGEKTLFTEANIENVFYKASNIEREDQKDSKTRSLLQNIQPLISAVEDYGKALDKYSNIASLYIAPIWGSIRVVLVIASSHGRFYDRIVDTFGRIGDILPRFRDYQRIFNGQKHQRFTQKLSEAYLDIITLCTEFRTLLRQQKKSSVKRIFQPLSPALNAHLEEAVARFRQHRKAVDKEAEVCHMLEEKEIRDLVHRNSEAAEAREREAKQEKLLSLLSKIDHEYKHRRMQKIRHPGTAGCGKSVLISSLIDGLLSPPIKPEVRHTIAFYYCDHADKRTLDPVNIFCCLARQCVGVSDGLPPSTLVILEEIFREGKIPEIEGLIELILNAIKRKPPLIVFIDGLDELNDEDRKLVFLKLTNLVTEAGPCAVKIFLTSREDTAYLTKAQGIRGFKVRIGASTIAGDIDSFVKHAIRELIERRELTLGNPSLEDEISTALIQGAKGMFLWVKFQLADLCAADTDEAISNVLQNLPNDLGETYTRLLGRIEGIKRRKYVKRMFNWIISARRPLHVNELREAIAFTIEDREFDAKKIPNDMNRLVRACGNLLVIDEDTENIQLAHYTVEQYLLDSSKTWGFRVTRKEANYELGKFCVAYLSFSDFETQITKFSNDVTPGLAALENVVGTQTLLNISGGFVTKAVTMLHNYHHSPTNIEFGRHISVMKLPSEDPMAKYSLLSYVVRNWLHHTTEFTEELQYGNSEDILAMRLFLELVFEKQLTFDFTPWKAPSNQQDKEFCFTLQLIWAISNHNIPVLQGVLKRDRTPLGHYLLRVSDWFFGGPGLPKLAVSKQMLSRPKEHSFDNLAPPDSWWGWLYAELLRVLRLGEMDTVNILLESLRILSPLDIWRMQALLEHFIFEAAAHRQNIVATTIWTLMKSRGEFTDNTHFISEYDGIPCGILERSAFAGSADVMDLLFAGGYSISPSIRPKVLQNLRLQVACKQGDLALIRCLLKMAGGPSSTRTVPPVKLSFDETAKSNSAAISYAVGCLIQKNASYSEKDLEVEGLHMAIDTLLALPTQPSLQAGRWLLYNAITENRCERVKSLIQAGTKHPYPKIYPVCMLFNNELPLNLQKKGYLAVEGLEEVSPLSWAIFNNRLEIASLLLAAAIGTECRHSDLGYTALHVAVITESLAFIELLHKYDADFTVRDLKERNLEQFAAEVCGSERTKEKIIAAIKTRTPQP